MNPLVRRYLKTAIVFLLIGLLVGFWMLLSREFGLPMAARLRSAHTHALLVGFVLMMIAGVALWMFPRARAGEAPHQPLLAEIAWRARHCRSSDWRYSSRRSGHGFGVPARILRAAR